MRAIPQSACSENDSTDNIKGVVYYGDSPGTPSTTGYDYIDSCDDETPNLVPYVSKTVDDADWSDLETASVGKNAAGLFKWMLNSTSMVMDWKNPTLAQVMNGTTDFETENAVIELSEPNKWVYFVIETGLGVPHPIHLHGHDYFILAQGTGAYSSSVTLNTNNPPRRDTAILPGNGYLVMAWETDNPGVWLCHCHIGKFNDSWDISHLAKHSIGWHASEGFALQFVERASEIPDITTSSYVSDVCDSWTSFQNEYSIEQEDSGI
jgi:FtsP/CotA-like multicopper oxidase with cupredoxin domain